MGLVMIHSPAFRKSFHVNAIPQEGIIISSELGQLVFGGAIEQEVIHLIQHNLSADEIAERLAPRYPREKVYYTLLSMEQQGLLYDRSTVDEATFSTAWHHLALDLDGAQRATSQTPISIRSTSKSGIVPDLGAFAAYNLRIGNDGQSLVLLAEDYLDPELAEVNRQALAVGRSWMLVKPVGTL